MVAIATGERAPTFGIAAANSSIRSQEFQSLIASSASASSAAGAGATHGTTAIPQKDRCTMTVETLTND
jgi:hypothetical protein